MLDLEGLVNNRIGLSMALVMLFHLLAPVIANESNLAEEYSENYGFGIEVIVEANDSSEIQEKGMIPLRYLGNGEWNAWMSFGEDKGVRKAPDAEIRDTEVIQNENLPIRVVLEPNLPPHIAKERVEIISQRLGFQWEEIDDIEGREGEDEKIYASIPPDGSARIGVIQIPAMGDQAIVFVQEFASIQGVLWIEPDLPAHSRNSAAAAQLAEGMENIQPSAAWEWGLNGSGIILASADTGIDRDHACFRQGVEDPNDAGNMTGVPGENHRKILILNETIDDWDDPGPDHRHGTHTAGSLACWPIDEMQAMERGEVGGSYPSAITAASHAAKLVIQDIVLDSWAPPEIDRILVEGGLGGAVIHSESWGDDTTAYSQRSADLDSWLREHPWSIAVIAPGNQGSTVLEPANARNILSIGAANRNNDLYSWSNIGPTADGEIGIHLVAPGMGIKSAQGDGDHTSFNGGERTSTGTSMAAPVTASTLGLLQQMVEQGWLIDDEIPNQNVEVSSLRPIWATGSSKGGELLLGKGFTPSGSLIRALATASADSLEGGNHGSNQIGHIIDERQGWGRINLSKIIDWDELDGKLVDSDSSLIPAPGVWIHDSYRIKSNSSPKDLLANRMEQGSGSRPLDRITTAPLDPSGLDGPFLTNGKEVSWSLVPDYDTLNRTGELIIQLAWPDRPRFSSAHDDLDLCVSLDDQWHTCGNLLNNGKSIMDSSLNDSRARGDILSSIEGIRIPAVDIQGINRIIVRVLADDIGTGNKTGTLGINGDKIGFSLVTIGARPAQMRGEWNQWPNWSRGTLNQMGTSSFENLGGDVTINWRENEGNVEINVEEGMGVNAINGRENRTGAVIPITRIVNISDVSRIVLGIEEITNDSPWEFGNNPVLAEIVKCSAGILGCTSNGTDVTNLDENSMLSISWPVEFSGQAIIDVSVIWNNGSNLNALISTIIARNWDGKLSTIEVSNILDWNWYPDDALGNEPTIEMQNGGAKFNLEGVKGSGRLVISMPLDVNSSTIAQWTWVEGGSTPPDPHHDSARQLRCFEVEPLMENGPTKNVTDRDHGWSHPGLHDCEGIRVIFDMVWKNKSDLIQSVGKPWNDLAGNSDGAIRGLIIGTWTPDLSQMPWEISPNNGPEEVTCSMIVAGMSMSCQEKLNLEVGGEVIILHSWVEGNEIRSTALPLISPLINILDSSSIWISINLTSSLIQLDGPDIPLPLIFETTPKKDQKIIELDIFWPDRWPIKIEKLECDDLRILLPDIAEIYGNGTNMVIRPNSSWKWTISNNEILGENNESHIRAPLISAGRVLAPDSCLDEIVEDHSSSNNSTDDSRDVSANQFSELGEGLRVPIIIAWVGISSIMLGMIIRTKINKKKVKK